MNYESWYTGTYQHCNDPTDFDGVNPKCCVDGCDCDIECDDDYCERHQECDECSEREDCECNKINIEKDDKNKCRSNTQGIN